MDDVQLSTLGPLIRTAIYGEPDTNPLTDALQSKLVGIETGAQVNRTLTELNNLGIDAATVNGLTVETAVPPGAAFTDTTYTVGNGGLTEVNFTNTLKTKLDNIEVGATADQTGAEIVSLLTSEIGNNNWQGDTTYSVGDGGLTEINFTTAKDNKLSAIESGATADQTGSEIASLLNVELGGTDWQTDTTYTVGNGGLTEVNFTTVKDNKLAGIEDNATADLTGTEIALLLDAELGSSIWQQDTTYTVGDGGLTEINFTTAKDSKLTGIESGATADQTGAEIITLLDTEIGNSNWQSDTTYTGGEIVTLINSELGSSEWQNDTLTGNEIVSAIDLELGNSDWQLGGAAMTNTEIVSAIDTELGNTDWQTDTTYSIGNGGLTEVNFTTAKDAKLTGIEDNATADQTGSEIVAEIDSFLGNTDWKTDTVVEYSNVSEFANDAGYVTGVAWGEITGTLTSQTDLQDALSLKASNSALETVATSGNADDLTIKPKQVLTYYVSEEGVDAATGTAVLNVHAPFAMEIVDAKMSAAVAPTGGPARVDLNADTGSGLQSVFMDLLEIDDGERTTTTAATPPNLAVTSIPDDAEMTFDIDLVGTTAAGQGFKVYLIVRET